MEKRQISILVVDDSSTMRQLIKMMITKYFKCDVAEAKDGRDAFGQIGAGSFDLVITDPAGQVTKRLGSRPVGVILVPGNHTSVVGRLAE